MRYIVHTRFSVGAQQFNRGDEIADGEKVPSHYRTAYCTQIADEATGKPSLSVVPDAASVKGSK